MANVNKPVDLKKKEEDVNRKLQFYGIISAFQNGKVPSVWLFSSSFSLERLLTRVTTE